jgi:signal transduction histidine kinase/ActR/RegA family two-component response regulator
VKPGRWSYPLTLLALAASYFAAAKLGLSMAFVAEQVTSVWPPTGIALAAVLIFGPRVWPGILLGAFLANVTTDEPVATACGIAAGNTLEALAGAWLIHRLTDFRAPLERLRDVLALVAGGVLIGTLLSATIGTADLCLSGIQPWSRFGPIWTTWWLGDAMGGLLVAPVLLTWAGAGGLRRRKRRVAEAGLLILLLAAVSLTVFRAGMGRAISHHPLEYLIFPFVIWAAVRFGQRGTTAVSLVASGIAVWGTAAGLGPFATAGPSDRLALLLLFMGVVAFSALLLSAAIAERAQAEQALREADQRKDEFLAMLGHELRNPLAPILNAVELLRVEGDDPVALERQREVIYRQARQMVRLVDDLLDVARITRGKIEIRRDAMDLVTCVEQAVEAVRPLIEARGHRLSLSLPPHPITLAGDAVRLNQAVVNLLNNAARYTERGGCLSVELQRETGSAVVRVRDTGAGIAPDLLPHVFDLFIQGDRSLARAEGGLGIGLTLVKKIVELHGGTVSARSGGRNLGSEFTLRLPISDCGSPPLRAGNRIADWSEPVVPQSAIRNPQSRVLVVEDNRDAAETLSELLAAWGHEVHVAHDGGEGIELAQALHPDVVLLDIGLPGADGYEVCARLRRSPGLERTQIVAVTGYGQSSDRERSRAAGFHQHLVKPIDAADLRRVLAAVPESEKTSTGRP